MLDLAGLLRDNITVKSSNTAKLESDMNNSIISINAKTTDADIAEAVELANAQERLSAYNEATGKSVKKFSSKAAGIKQTVKALTAKRDAIREQAEADEHRDGQEPTDEEKAEVDAENLSKGACPLCGGDPGNQTPAGKEGTVAGDERNFCHECEREYWRATGEEYTRRNPGRDISKSISDSWKREDVAEARKTRHGVHVLYVDCNGEEHHEDYRSVKQAFEALGLPLGRHIKFRKELKAEGTKTFEIETDGDTDGKFHFTAVSK